MTYGDHLIHKALLAFLRSRYSNPGRGMNEAYIQDLLNAEEQ